MVQPRRHCVCGRFCGPLLELQWDRVVKQASCQAKNEREDTFGCEPFTGAVDGTSGFDFRRFFFGEFRNSGHRGFLSFLGATVCLLFRLFFFKFGAADNGIGFCFFRSLFVLGFDETGSECGDLVFVQLSFAPGGFRSVSNGLRQRLDDCAACGGRLLLSLRSFCCPCCLTFSAAVG